LIPAQGAGRTGPTRDTEDTGRAELRNRMAEVSMAELLRRAEACEAQMTPEAVKVALRGADGVRSRSAC